MKAIIVSLFCLIFFNEINRTQWVQTTGTPEGGGITDMVVTSNGTIVVTCASYNWPNGQYGGIRHSTDGGMTWENDYQHYTARTVALGQNNYVFASSWNYPSYSEALWVSHNHGITWQGLTYLVGANNNIFSILVRDNNQTVYIGTRTGVMKSTNGGFNFSAVNNGIPANSWVRDLAIKSNGNIYAATTNGIFKSTNSAASWTQMSGLASGDTAVKLCIYENPIDGNTEELVSGTQNGKLYDEGTNEFLTAFFLASATNEFSGIDGFGHDLFISQFNKGGSPGSEYSAYENGQWHVNENNEGLPDNRPISVVAVSPVINFFNSSNVTVFVGYYAGTSGGAKVFKRNFTIGIKQISSEIPDGFALLQNYPNPFNPVTKIKFNIPLTSNVSIRIFDIQGRVITTLVNDKLNGGTYETEWNAINTSSGVYFYRIESGNYTETKKMILVK